MEASDFFIDLPIETNAQTLADEAVERLQVRWPGWEPNDADLEVVQIETLSPMAENAAETAALVPGAVFREYGQKLIGRAYDPGTQAVASLTFTFIDPSGYTIPAGAEIDIDGFAFTVDTETLVPVDSDSVSGVEAHAVIEGAEANGLTGANVSALSGLAGIDDITLEGPTVGGSDGETDEDYQNNLSVELQLQAKTIITTRDFELWALRKEEVGRALAVHTGDRAVTVVAVTEEGTVVSTATKNELIADYAEYRLVNTVVTMADPTYTTIDVTYTVVALPGFDHADLEARIDAMLIELLSPDNWGMPKGASVLTTWVNEPVVRANLLIDRIGDVDGVNYVSSVSIVGSAGSASGSNWTMAGAYPLPNPGVMTGTIT
jgi:hypothetical protein